MSRWARQHNGFTTTSASLGICLGQLSLPSLQNRQIETSFGWKGIGRYGSLHSWINASVAGKTVCPLANACPDWALLRRVSLITGTISSVPNFTFSVLDHWRRPTMHHISSYLLTYWRDIRWPVGGCCENCGRLWTHTASATWTLSSTIDEVTARTTLHQCHRGHQVIGQMVISHGLWAIWSDGHCTNCTSMSVVQRSVSTQHAPLRRRHSSVPQDQCPPTTDKNSAVSRSAY